MRRELLYFAYGSNLLPHRLRARVPSARPLAPARLPGYTLSFAKYSRDGSGKCTLEPAPGGQIWGGVYRLARHELRLLDRAEGLGYRRIRVRVQLADERWVSASTYLARAAARRPGLAPWDWYHRLVLRGAASFGLPAAYQRRLAAQPALPDPNRRRQAANERILRQAASRRRSRHGQFDRTRKREIGHTRCDTGAL